MLSKILKKKNKNIDPVLLDDDFEPKHLKENRLLNMKMPFGKYKGTAVKYLPKSYVWGLLQNFPVKGEIREALLLIDTSRSWAYYPDDDYDDYFDSDQYDLEIFT